MFVLVCSFQKYKPCLHNLDFDTFDQFEQCDKGYQSKASLALDALEKVLHFKAYK